MTFTRLCQVIQLLTSVKKLKVAAASAKLPLVNVKVPTTTRPESY
jgi:hypothetical protein